ncbi:hypothetical protein PS627_04367 [Pseudomonas fluorescens]|nr:hypothetical protein PS627_04367 [Pseudomonas fluorescens]
MASSTDAVVTFAASVGLVPRQYSTGGNANLLGICKRRQKMLIMLNATSRIPVSDGITKLFVYPANKGKELLLRLHSK